MPAQLHPMALLREVHFSYRQLRVRGPVCIPRDRRERVLPALGHWWPLNDVLTELVPQLPAGMVLKDWEQSLD